MERKRFARLSQRLGALLLAGATLWTVYATAGSVDAAGAWMAVKRELPLALLQWQLGDMGQRDGLSAPSVLMLSQAPILLSARGEISDLRRQAAEEPEDERPAPVTQPVREEPQPAPVTAGADNGVTAKTLIPTDPSGYTVCGKVYIRNTTQYTLSNEELLKPFAAELTGEAPQILILHSHGSEGYTPAVDDGIVWSGDHRTTDSRYNVVRMGDAMAEVFAQAGISVLHDRTLYDYPEYAGAYDRSLAGIDRYLKEYPSIRFVLDVHRDAIETSDGSQVKVVSEIEGQGTAAQLSLIMGSDGGGLSHPDWMENLRAGGGGAGAGADGLSHADAASASAEFPIQSTRHHRFSAGGGGDRRKRPGGGGAGRPPVCGRAGKNAGGTKQVGNCPATAGQFLRNNKGVHSTFHIYC